MITNDQFDAELKQDYSRYSGWDFVTYEDETALADDIKALNSVEFRSMLSESLDDKQKEYDSKTKELEKFKLALRIATEKVIRREYADSEDLENILSAFWDWSWVVMSRDDIAELKALAGQMRNLRVALRLARSYAGEPTTRKSKFGYSDDEIAEANDVSITEFLDGNYRETGHKLIVRCPFHNEKTGSFVIYADNSWHCFGCSAHGMGAIDFIMRKNDVGFLEAVKFILRK